MSNNYKQYKKAKKEKNMYTAGQVATGSLAALGAGQYGLAKLVEKQAKEAKPGTVELIRQIQAGGKNAAEVIPPEKLIKFGKKAGKIAGIAGGTGLALTTIAKQRSKRKLKELEKDDNKKKE